MFVCLANGDANETAKYIKSVTYRLHPTFKPAVVKLEMPPFLISRVGWGYFEIQVEIEYKPITGIKEIHKLTHELNFD